MQCGFIFCHPINNALIELLGVDRRGNAREAHLSIQWIENDFRSMLVSRLDNGHDKCFGDSNWVVSLLEHS